MKRIVAVFFCILAVIALLVNLGLLSYRAHLADYVSIGVSPLNRLVNSLRGFFPENEETSYSFYWVTDNGDGSYTSGIDWIVVEGVPTKFPIYKTANVRDDVIVFKSNLSFIEGYELFRYVRPFRHTETILVDPDTDRFHIVSLDRLTVFDSLSDLNEFLDSLN